MYVLNIRSGADGKPLDRLTFVTLAELTAYLLDVYGEDKNPGRHKWRIHFSADERDKTG
jgi:hypothetical protein